MSKTGAESNGRLRLEERAGISERFGFEDGWLQRVTGVYEPRKAAPEVMPSDQGPELRFPVDGTVTILFTDIEGFARLMDRLGDWRARQVLRAHNALVGGVLAAHGAFVVKSLGDGFMAVFTGARRAVRCAIAVQEALATNNAKRPDVPLRVRMGLHTGEVTMEAGDFADRTVVLAARIAAEARGGEILISLLVRELTESAGEFTFAEARKVRLKGLSGMYRLFAVNRLLPVPVENGRATYVSPARG